MSRVWCNGALLAEQDVRISPFDHGLLTGDGVFETLLARDGVVFGARRHLERLARSASAMELAVPDDEVLRGAMAQVMEANGLRDARLRVTVTGGPAPPGSERGESPPTVIVAATEPTAWPPTATVAVVPWTRNERGALAGAKTISYGENVVALAWARRRGAGEALFGNNAGNLCEGTGSNVFVMIGGRLLTPPVTSGCLAGVVRALLVEGSIAQEADVPMSALGEIEAAFLTSSTREVQPIDRWDDRPLPGAFAQADEALALLQRLWKESPDP